MEENVKIWAVEYRGKSEYIAFGRKYFCGKYNVNVNELHTNTLFTPTCIWKTPQLNQNDNMQNILLDAKQAVTVKFEEASERVR